jgi:CubicO group peptidase (beta-lactamase class C family)
VKAAGADVAVDTYVTAQMRQDHIPGLSLAVVRDGRVVLARGYGFANVEARLPATPDTVYEVMSLTKQFVAAAILRLVEAHRLTLNLPLAAILPHLPPTWDPITLRQLLAQTSGIPDYTEVPGFTGDLRQEVSPQALLQPVQARPLLFAPGTQWGYSNSNYLLLGLVLERVTGHSVAQALHDAVFAPLGMTATRVNDLAAIIPRRAAGYTWRGTQLENAGYVSPTQMGAAGDVISTVLDLARWDQALALGQLLTRSDTALMATPTHLPDGTLAPYGLGTELDMVNGHRVVGHQGSGLGFNATLARFVDDHLTVIVLCNLTGAPSQPIARHIATLYLPALSYASEHAIADPEPGTTARLREVLVSLQHGSVNPAFFAPSARAGLQGLGQEGRRLLGSLGPLHTFALLQRTVTARQRVYRYRAVFGTTPLIWSFTLDIQGRIVNFAPQQQ